MARSFERVNAEQRVRPTAPIHVSGAGLSGLAAAVAASRAGRRVVVHERAADVGHRFHGDLQGLENWTTPGDVLDELAALGIDAGFDYSPVREAVVFDPRGREHTYRSPRPICYLVRRGAGAGTLDSSLKAQALGQGSELHFGEERCPPPAGGIVAHGPHRADAVAIGYEFATTAADGAYGALSDRLAPGGYAYLLVARGRGTVASFMIHDFRNGANHLERTVAFFRERVGFDMKDARRIGGVGAFAAPTSAGRGSLLYVGEAAGFQDALWGFGMRYAMVSGALAAQCVARNEPHAYDRLWQTRFGGLLRTAIVNRCVYDALGERGRMLLVRWLDGAADPRGSLGRLYRPSLLTRFLYPIARSLRVPS